MPFLKFGKGKDKDEDLDGVDIEEVEEGGLLMSTNLERPAPAARPDLPAATISDGEDDDVDALDPAGAQSLGPDDNLPAAVAAEDEDSSADASDAASEAGGTEPDGGPDATDDLMAAFKDEATHGDLRGLVEEIEDVPIGELLEELREVRAMLPAEALEGGDQAA